MVIVLVIFSSWTRQFISSCNSSISSRLSISQSREYDSLSSTNIRTTLVETNAIVGSAISPISSLARKWRIKWRRSIIISLEMKALSQTVNPFGRSSSIHSMQGFASTLFSNSSIGFPRRNFLLKRIHLRGASIIVIFENCIHFCSDCNVSWPFVIMPFDSTEWDRRDWEGQKWNQVIGQSKRSLNFRDFLYKNSFVHSFHSFHSLNR